MAGLDEVSPEEESDELLLLEARDELPLSVLEERTVARAEANVSAESVFKTATDGRKTGRERDVPWVEKYRPSELAVLGTAGEIIANEHVVHLAGTSPYSQRARCPARRSRRERRGIKDLAISPLFLYRPSEPDNVRGHREKSSPLSERFVQLGGALDRERGEKD